MKSGPTSCGFDPKAMKEIRRQLASGELTAVFYRPTGRVLYVTEAELAGLKAADYTLLPHDGEEGPST